jgi:RepB DNA-primase from phage plasmid
MLDAFASVGVAHFDLTHLDIDGEKRGFRRSQSIAQLKNSLPYLLKSASERKNNVIVRPHQPVGALLVQLDDLDPAILKGRSRYMALRT